MKAAHSHICRRVAVLIDQLRYAGVEKIAVKEVLALRRMGIEATLVVMRRRASDEHTFKEILENIPVVFLSDRLPRIFCLSFKFPILAFFSLFHVTFPFLAISKVSRKEFDITVSHGTYTCLTAITLSKLRDIPFIAYIWDPSSYITGRVYSERVRFALLQSLMKGIGLFIDKCIVKNSRITLTACRKHLATLSVLDNPKKIRILYPSIDSASEVKAPKENYVLVATAWKEGKEPEYLLEMVRRNKDLKFVVAGSWHPQEYQKKFLDKIKSFGLQEQITVTGTLSEEKLKELYKKALVFLQFKADIGFGMPALEAAANGCTFIIPKGQGVCDLFENGVDGFYIKEKDDDAIIKYLKLLHKERELAIKMGVSAWTKVKQKHSWAKHSGNILHLYSIS